MRNTSNCRATLELSSRRRLDSVTTLSFFLQRQSTHPFLLYPSFPRPPLPPIHPPTHPMYPNTPSNRQGLLDKLAGMGVSEVQLHEPALVLWDSFLSLGDMFRTAYSASKVNWAYTEEAWNPGDGKTRRTLSSLLSAIVFVPNVCACSTCVF